MRSETAAVIAIRTSEVETAGDPMSAKKWVRLSLSQLSPQLQAADQSVSPPTIARLLDDLDYALRANVKSNEPGSDHPDRDRQFQHIAKKKRHFLGAGLPVISVDTKKKERIGNFKNPGRMWCQQPES
jgi:hypothetical protein